MPIYSLGHIYSRKLGNKKMQHRLLSHTFDRIIISVPKYNYFGKPIRYNFLRVHWIQSRPIWAYYQTIA